MSEVQSLHSTMFGAQSVGQVRFVRVLEGRFACCLTTTERPHFCTKGRPACAIK